MVCTQTILSVSQTSVTFIQPACGGVTACGFVFCLFSACTDALFPADTADVLGRQGNIIRNASGGQYVLDATGACPHADRGQVLAANTTVVRSTVAVGNNTNNRTVFWSPTGGYTNAMPHRLCVSVCLCVSLCVSVCLRIPLSLCVHPR